MTQPDNSQVELKGQHLNKAKRNDFLNIVMYEYLPIAIAELLLVLSYL